MKHARATKQEREQARLRRAKRLRIGGVVLLVLVAGGVLVARYYAQRGFRLLASDGQPIHRAIMSGPMVDGPANGEWEYEGGYCRRAGPRDGGPLFRQRVLAAWLEDGSPALGGTTVFEIPPDTESVEIRLPPEAPISGRVVDATGAPAGDVEVYLELADVEDGRDHSPWFYDSPWFKSTSGADGRFTISGTAASETYEVFVDPGGFGNPVRVGKIQGGTRDLDVVLDTLRPIPITVVRTDGRPVKDVKVWVTATLFGADITPPHSIEFTGTDGRVTIRRLASDMRYWLLVDGWRGGSADGRPAMLGAVRKNWSPEPERIVLVETVVSVVDASGDPVPRATLWVILPGMGGGPHDASERGTLRILAERGREAKIVALPPATIAHPAEGVEDDRFERWKAHARSTPRLGGGETLTILPTQEDGEIEIVVQQPTKGR